MKESFEINDFVFHVWPVEPARFESSQIAYCWTIYFYQNHLWSLDSAKKLGLNLNQFHQIRKNLPSICREGGLRAWIESFGVPYKSTGGSNKFGPYFDGTYYNNLSDGAPYFLGSDYWKQLREKVYERDGWACVLCQSGAEIHAHHMSYKRLANDGEVLDVVTLCKDCHKEFHEDYKYDQQTEEYIPRDSGRKEEIIKTLSLNNRAERDLYQIWKNGDPIEPPFCFPVEQYLPLKG
tara:strand:+ start:7007 stop:7714 length:708 start_codon:yes stop_codon:yes gene_type:complete